MFYTKRKSKNGPRNKTRSLNLNVEKCIKVIIKNKNEILIPGV